MAIIKLFRTVTFRMALLFLSLFAGAALIAIAYISWNSQRLLDQRLDQTIAAQTRGLVEQFQSGGIRQLASAISTRSRRPGASIYLVTDREGRYIAGNVRALTRDLWNQLGRVSFTYQRQGPKGAERRPAVARIYRLKGGYRLLVGRDIEDRRNFERIIRSAALWGLGFMGLVGLGGGWLVSRNLLRRIDEMSVTGKLIMTGDLSQRVPVSGAGDEFDRLARNLNDMLARIEELMTGLREVSDNIAHDLKTPLNRMRNRVEDALRGPGGEEACREALTRTIEEADDLMRTFNALLSIARLEAGAQGPRREQLDLADIVRDVVELYEPAAEGDNVELRLGATPSLPVTADRQLIGQALANLLDNALKYGAEEKQTEGEPLLVTVSLEEGRGGVSHMAALIVADNGPGIPKADRERVLNRFVRLESSRSQPGSGLGLSLVAAVARLHNGGFRLEDNHPGLKAVVTLPVARTRPAGK